MKSLFCFFTIIVISVSVRAGIVSGQVIKVYGKNYLQTTQFKMIEITTQDKATLETIEKLSTGDFILGYGENNTETNSLDLNYIDFVGLKILLGSWSTQKNSSYLQFNTFNDMGFITKLSQINGPYSDAAIYKFKYTITPSSDSSWLMFFSDRNSTQAARIEVISANQIRIDFFNQSTGEISKELLLNRVNRNER